MLYCLLFVTKDHFLLLFQLIFWKLSIVRSTYLWNYRIKILILSGTFIFQMYFITYKVWPFSKSKYIDLTVKAEIVNPHWNESSLSDKLTSINPWTKCNYIVHLLSVSILLQAIFRGTWPIRCESQTSFHYTLL
jgi:hypothetical protein